MSEEPQSAEEQAMPMVRAIKAAVEEAVADAREHDAEIIAKLRQTIGWMKIGGVALAVVFAGMIWPVAFTVYQAVDHPLSNRLSQEITANQALTKNLEKYTDQKVQNECSALELLTRTPVAKPADPAANPSREVTYQFYLALKYWETKDGCGG